MPIRNDQTIMGIRPLLAGTSEIKVRSRMPASIELSIKLVVCLLTTWTPLRAANRAPHASGPLRQSPGRPDRGHGLELGLWAVWGRGGLHPLPDEPPTSRQDGLVAERPQARHEGRTTSHHPTTHLCSRPVGGLGWVRLPRAAHLTCSHARHAGLPMYLIFKFESYLNS